MPKVWTGNFAQVYELRNGQARWAVKCFTRSSADIRRRYEIISQAIAANRLPYFVEFRLVDAEMLVNGKRFPVVKMQWVDGVPLDKYVEAHLFEPQVLLELASKITRMVADLESKGLAHGDLQHGNILVCGNDLKLVDYDGMYVPAFQGERSPETGLPSYQHPRRDASVYNSAIDRFPLVVICAGLCALAVEPRLWYEFSTGDNLLFKREDFENIDRSPIFARLRNLRDEQARYFAETLREACKESPSQIKLPEASISLKVTSTVRPWWVSASPDATGPAPASKVETKAYGDRADLLAILRSHWSFASSLTGLVGLVVLSSTDLLGGEATFVLSLGAGAAYLMERHHRFRALPVFSRRQALTRRIAELDRECTSVVENQNRLQNETSRLTPLEAQEKTNTLKAIQERELNSALSQVDISRLSQISGVGPHLIGNLRAAGFHNASQLHQSPRWSGVRGIGPKRHAQIAALLRRWTNEAQRRLSTRLPADIETQIAAKYQQQRRALVDQLAFLGNKLASTRSELQQRQAELGQSNVPSFGQFLKHNL
jgi:serine/threonine protein kinase